MAAIESVQALRGIQTIQNEGRTAPASGMSDAAKKFDAIISEIDTAQKNADAKVVGLATGDVQDVHQVMIAMNEADLSFRLMLEVRNRIVDAYHEISRLQM